MVAEKKKRKFVDLDVTAFVPAAEKLEGQGEQVPAY